MTFIPLDLKIGFFISHHLALGGLKVKLYNCKSWAQPAALRKLSEHINNDTVHSAGSKLRLSSVGVWGIIISDFTKLLYVFISWNIKTSSRKLENKEKLIIGLNVILSVIALANWLGDPPIPRIFSVIGNWQVLSKLLTVWGELDTSLVSNGRGWAGKGKGREVSYLRKLEY